MEKIFVSYGRQDLEQVQQIVQELSSLGLEFWIDTRNLQVGDLWTREITKGIDACGKLLLFMSGSSMSSDNVRREVQLAFEKNKRILLLRLDDAPIPADLQFLITGIHWTKYASPDWKSHLLVALGNYASSPPENKSEKISSEVNEPVTQNAEKDIPAIIARIERLYYNNRLSKDRKESFTTFLKEALDHPMKEEKMTPQEMDPKQVADLYKNSSYTVAHYLTSLAEHQPEFLNQLPGDPKTEYAINVLGNMQQQILLVATVAEIHSPSHYEIYQFESQMILTSIRKLKALLGGLDKYRGSSEDIPDNIKMQLDEEFDNLIFGAERILLLMQELAQPKRKSFLQ